MELTQSEELRVMIAYILTSDDETLRIYMVERMGKNYVFWIYEAYVARVGHISFYILQII